MTSNSITTTPPADHTLPSDCLFSPYCAVTINAPASHAAKCTLDTTRWNEWNAFVPEVTITHEPSRPSQNGGGSEPSGPSGPDWLRVGTKMTFKCEMKGKGRGSTFNSKEEVTRVEMPPPAPASSSHSNGLADSQDSVYSIRWSSRGFGFMLRAERVHELKSLPAADGEGGGWRGAVRVSDVGDICGSVRAGRQDAV